MYMALAGAAMGALSGSQGSSSSQTQSSTSRVHLRNINDLNKGRSGMEQQTNDGSLNQYNQLGQMINAGPGQADIQQANIMDRDLADRMNQFSMNGPNQNQIDQAKQFATGMFAPQEQALKFAFQDQEVQSNRLAARLGRSGNDPVLRAKMAQEQTRQMADLNAQKTQTATQYAYGSGDRMMQMGNAVSNLRNGLASQAFNNRQTLLQLGQQMTQAERDYRVGTATRTTDTTMTSATPGGLGGALNGAIAGAGAGMGAMSAFSSLSKKQEGINGIR